MRIERKCVDDINHRVDLWQYKTDLGFAVLMIKIPKKINTNPISIVIGMTEM